MSGRFGFANVLLTACWPSGHTVNVWADSDTALNDAHAFAMAGAESIYLNTVGSAVVWKWKDTYPEPELSRCDVCKRTCECEWDEDMGAVVCVPCYQHHIGNRELNDDLRAREEREERY